ncbi:MAG: S1 RNA-binding domain-containing protein [Candidatus Pacearchaeota archaeon]|nr:S1 RNA-binding domain-containing protein [Candidatus Pacearchaeota archaeon]
MKEHNINEGDIVICTVKKIESATVFVDIEENGEGTIVLSEIAAGRIRNLRDYVSPNKVIVCKVLKIDPSGTIHLSLRRVTSKEREEAKEKYQKEMILKKLLKSIIKNPEQIIEKIKKSFSLAEFFDNAKENPKIIEEYLPKDKAQELSKLITEKKEKEKIAKQTIMLKSLTQSGINDIKSILTPIKNVDISYLGSSKFSLIATAKDFKEANSKILQAIETIKTKAKEKHILFEQIETKK